MPPFSVFLLGLIPVNTSVKTKESQDLLDITNKGAGILE
jgi:hypothetical protein